MRAGKAKNLAELAARVPGAVLTASVPVTGIKIDSRRAREGDLFVCVPGFQTDGHDFAAAALANGAAALVVSRRLDAAVPQLIVPDTREAAGYLAAAFYDEPCRRLRLTGVTGTNGKTTTTHLMERIAREAGCPAGLIGTLGARLGAQSWLTEHTTPEAVDLQCVLARMSERGARAVIMEVSSHALDLGRVNGCSFAAAVFTNLTQDHLDYHSTMERYWQAKAKLFTVLPPAPGAFALINIDQEEGERLAAGVSCRRVTYGLENPAADYRAGQIRQEAGGVRFAARRGEREEEIFSAAPGRFSVYNALAAWAWALESGYAPEAARRALAAPEGVPGRFESIRGGQDFQVIVDYAHTPDGLENVLRAARDLSAGRLITVFGCGGDRDRAKRPLMGEAAARRSDYVVVTSDNPRTEKPEAIIEDILPGLAGTDTDWEILTDRRAAIRRAIGLAAPGDIVVIAGKGHEDYQIIGKEKIHFDDREEARLALAGRPDGVK
ncbi:MAG: UDP-N-acetylmuramoyl-L-alanyl-D-glutamate--2,6-diaminopimelate ligase [Gracilibacteraceae bacterium]|jgi:UDP-N-acetylmuramoyl-L-alanyl-D-glutamate--2,6-diaminopimelate ligase|nr:UDP-N-acetylmuramoyl-L-alanyl-D-glutamate--2,6-diaminopimelate ligase [Gracilibacteraceae bacterium]